MDSNPIGPQIFFPRSHARVTLFLHISTEPQFHHHSFIIDYSLIRFSFPYIFVLLVDRIITFESSKAYTFQDCFNELTI